jgi:hypothetical protein
MRITIQTDRGSSRKTMLLVMCQQGSMNGKQLGDATVVCPEYRENFLCKDVFLKLKCWCLGARYAWSMDCFATLLYAELYASIPRRIRSVTNAGGAWCKVFVIFPPVGNSISKQKKQIYSLSFNYIKTSCYKTWYVSWFFMHFILWRMSILWHLSNLPHRSNFFSVDTK